MKLTWHDAGRIIGSVAVYLLFTLLLGFPKDCLWLGIPVAALLFPLVNLGEEIEQAQTEKAVTLDHLFDVTAALPGVPLGMALVGEPIQAAILGTIIAIALYFLWKYRVPREDGGQSSPTVTKL